MTWTCHYHNQLRTVVIREHGFTIARIEDATADSIQDRLERGRMMAAAPELMEACEAALEFLRGDLDANDPDIPDEEIQELMQVGGALHLALAKARDEEER